MTDLPDLEKTILGWIGFARTFFQTPREKIDLDAMAAADELLGETQTMLSTPANKARLARVKKAIVQDFGDLLSPSPPALAPSDPVGNSDSDVIFTKGGLQIPKSGGATG